MGLNTEMAKKLGGGGGAAPRTASAPTGGARGLVAAGPGDTGNISDRGRPIGVSPDYRVFRQGPLADTGNLLGTGPRYYAGAELEPAGRDPGDIANIQRRLEGAGILNGKYRLGYWDNKTKNAYKQLLGYANQRGQSWEEALGEIQATGGVAGGGGGGVRRQTVRATFQVPEYLPPDYEALESGARRVFKQQMKRDPSDSEMALFGKMLSDGYHSRYHAEVDAERRRFEKQKPLIEGHEDSDHVHRVTEAQVSREEPIDPWARLDNYIQEKYGESIKWLENEENVRHTMQTLQAGLSGVANMMRNF